METLKSRNEIKRKISKGEITLDDVYTADYQKKGTLTAQLRQTVTVVSEYPSARAGNSLSDSLYSDEAFGFEANEYTSVENRVAWINVPEGETKASVSKLLKAAIAGGATLYRVLSNHPILTEEQKYSVESGQKTLDDYANAQVIRYPESDTEKSLQIIFDRNGKVQYRKTFFSKSPVEDVDYRNADVTDFYISAELEEEVNAVKGPRVVKDQTL